MGHIDTDLFKMLNFSNHDKVSLIKVLTDSRNPIIKYIVGNRGA